MAVLVFCGPCDFFDPSVGPVSVFASSPLPPRFSLELVSAGLLSQVKVSTGQLDARVLVDVASAPRAQSPRVPWLPALLLSR